MQNMKEYPQTKWLKTLGKADVIAVNSLYFTKLALLSAMFKK